MWTEKDQYNFDSGARHGMAMSMMISGLVTHDIFSALEEAEKWFELFSKDLEEQWEIIPIVQEIFSPLINEKNEKHFERLIMLSL